MGIRIKRGRRLWLLRRILMLSMGLELNMLRYDFRNTALKNIIIFGHVGYGFVLAWEAYADIDIDIW